MIRWVTAGVVAVVVGIALTGCGESAAQKAAASVKASAAARASALASAAAATKRTEAKLQATCQKTFGAFGNELQTLNSKLGIGLTEDAFNNELADINVTYSKLTAAPLNVENYCINKVGDPLQAAFRLYIASNTSWNNCISSYYCDFKHDVEPKIQAKWTKAQKDIEGAESVLSDYQSPAGVHTVD